MKTKVQYFNSQEAAKILGVNVSSIKRWTEEGKLECVKTAGGHRKFFLEHLANFLEQHKKKTARINLFPIEDATDLEISSQILKGNFDFLRAYLVTAALDSNRDRVQQVLNGLYLGQYPLYEIYDRLVTPALIQIGTLFQQSQLTVIEEHFATQAIRDSLIRLQGIIRIPKEKIGTAVCLNLSTELHDLALKMIDHLLELRGFKVLFSGQITPVLNFEQIFSKFRPDRIYISSTLVSDIFASQAELDHISRLCQKNQAELYVGGQGFEKIKLTIAGVGRRLHTFEEIFSF